MKTRPLAIPLAPVVRRHAELSVRERHWRKNFGLSYSRLMAANAEHVLTVFRLHRGWLYSAVRPRGVG